MLALAGCPSSAGSIEEAAMICAPTCAAVRARSSAPARKDVPRSAPMPATTTSMSAAKYTKTRPTEAGSR